MMSNEPSIVEQSSNTTNNKIAIKKPSKYTHHFDCRDYFTNKTK